MGELGDLAGLEAKRAPADLALDDDMLLGGVFQSMCGLQSIRCS